MLKMEIYALKNIQWTLFIIILGVCVSSQNPVISFISPEQIRDIGDSVQINCSVENIRDFSVAWSKRQRNHPSDSVILSIGNALAFKDPRYKLIEDSNTTTTTYSLEISSIDAIDMGIYECQVITSPSEKVTDTVELLVKHSPMINESHTTKLVTVEENHSTELKCIADGYPRPTISWKRQFDNIMPAGGQIYSGNKLIVKSAQREDRGTYYCIAGNNVGSPAQTAITLQVEFPPKIIVPRPKIAQAQGYDIELECKIEAYPAPAVSWHKANYQLSNSRHYLITNTATSSDITTSTLRIFSIDDDDYGDYFCNATNKLKQTSARVHLFEWLLAVPPTL